MEQNMQEDCVMAEAAEKRHGAVGGLPESPGLYVWTHAVAPVAGMLGLWACTGAVGRVKGEVANPWYPLALAGVYAAGAVWVAWRERARGRIGGLAMFYSVVGILLAAPMFAAALGFGKGEVGPVPWAWTDGWLGRRFWRGVACCPMLYATVVRWLRLFGPRRVGRWSVAWLLGAVAFVCGIFVGTSAPEGGGLPGPPSTPWRWCLVLGGGLVMTASLARLLLDAVAWLRARRSSGPHRGRWRVATAAVLGAASVGSVAGWIRLGGSPLPPDGAGWLLAGMVLAALASLAPVDRAGRAGLAAWWGRWLAAPCAAYFFLLALPTAWVAAAPPPMTLFGLAYLAPVLAFQHWQKDVAESWTALRRAGHGRVQLAAVALSAAWVLPAWTLWHLAE